MNICYVNDRINYEILIIHSLRGYILMHLFEANVSMNIFYRSTERNDCLNWKECIEIPVVRALNEDETAATLRMLSERNVTQSVIQK